MKRLLSIALLLTACATTQTVGDGVAVVQLSSPLPATTIPLGTVLLEDYIWIVPEAPQIDMWGHGNWDSPEFTIMYPPWLIEQTGTTKITIHRTNGTHLARPVIDQRFAIAEGGTFWLEIESYGSWGLHITEGSIAK